MTAKTGDALTKPRMRRAAKPFSCWEHALISGRTDARFEEGDAAASIFAQLNAVDEKDHGFAKIFDKDG